MTILRLAETWVVIRLASHFQWSGSMSKAKRGIWAGQGLGKRCAQQAKSLQTVVQRCSNAHLITLHSPSDDILLYPVEMPAVREDAIIVRDHPEVISFDEHWIDDNLYYRERKAAAGWASSFGCIRVQRFAKKIDQRTVNLSPGSYACNSTLGYCDGAPDRLSIKKRGIEGAPFRFVIHAMKCC